MIVESDRIHIVKRRGTVVSRCELSRQWARVVRDREPNAPERARLLVGSHGSSADDINEADRAIVARKLEQLLRAPA